MSENTDLVKKEEFMPERNENIPTSAPLVDIFENDDEILLYADMPGVEKNNISINIDNGKLTISGLRVMKDEGVKNWAEFGNVDFQRTFSVPQTIDVGAVNAELKDGVLRLHLPKSEAAKPRQIEIKSA